MIHMMILNPHAIITGLTSVAQEMLADPADLSRVVSGAVLAHEVGQPPSQPAVSL